VQSIKAASCSIHAQKMKKIMSDRGKRKAVGPHRREENMFTRLREEKT